MKASLTLREERPPLLSAKVPISILGLPFFSGVGFSAGDAPEVRLDIGTAFESGPSIRLSYRPNDAFNTLSLTVKTGIGASGSPFAAPMSMTAEFGLLRRSGVASPAPAFCILFKPRVGDFSLKKAVRSATANTLTSAKIAEDVGFDADATEHQGIRSPHQVASGSLLSLPDLTASSVLPLHDGATVRFQWGIRPLGDIRTGFAVKNPMPWVFLNRLPRLVMSKISIERVAAAKKPPESRKADESKRSNDFSGTFAILANEIEALRVDNVSIRKAVEEIRSTEAGFMSKTPHAVVDVGRAGETSKSHCGYDGKQSVQLGRVSAGEIEEELKKTLMGAAAASAGGIATPL